MSKVSNLYILERCAYMNYDLNHKWNIILGDVNDLIIIRVYFLDVIPQMKSSRFETRYSSSYLLFSEPLAQGSPATYRKLCPNSLNLF